MVKYPRSYRGRKRKRSFFCTRINLWTNKKIVVVILLQTSRFLSKMGHSPLTQKTTHALYADKIRIWHIPKGLQNLIKPFTVRCLDSACFQKSNYLSPLWNDGSSQGVGCLRIMDSCRNHIESPMTLLVLCQMFNL